MDLQGMVYPALILGGLGLVFGLLLAYASQRFHVETDPRVEQVRALLPGANCGGCGFPGCDGYAEAVVLEGAKPNLCAAGGAELAASLKCVSADHLLHVSDTGIKRLARAGVVATLLPLTAFSLNEPYAPARKMIDAGCAVALASDLNPGSCFSASIPMMIALACIYMKMTPEEAVTALTINGAAAVGRASEIGSISVGKRADVILLKYPSYKFLPYHVGMNLVDTVIKDGELYMM